MYLYTAGIGTLAFASCILIVDIRGYTRWTFLGVVYGANAITSYVLAGVLTLVFYGMRIGGASLNEWFMNGLAPLGLDPRFVSMLYAIIIHVDHFYSCTDPVQEKDIHQSMMLQQGLKAT